MYSSKRPAMTVAEYKQKANSRLNKLPEGLDNESVERRYWDTIAVRSALYGADVPASITDENVDVRIISTDDVRSISDRQI